MRTWLIVGMVLMVVTAYLGAFGVATLNELTYPLRSQAGSYWPRRELEELGDLVPAVEGAADQWEDPAWQAEIGRRLTAQEIGVHVFGHDGRLLFSHPTVRVPSSGIGGTRVYAGGRLAGEVRWFELRVMGQTQRSDLNDFLDNIVIPVSIVLVVSGTVWLFVSLAARGVLNPLRALAEAAARIRGGELDVAVPDSRVRELNEFASAFAEMRDGLRESLGRQSELEQERRVFIAAMAHDLRTPLTSVRGYLEGIRDGVARTPEMMDRYVGIALEKTAALERLVDGLFNFSRTEYLSQTPNREPLDLGAFLAETVDGFAPQAEAKDVALNLDAGPEPIQVLADPAMLHRVVDNLLDNALRHTPAGGSVTVGWRGGLSEARFWVQDSGQGLPPDELDRVFTLSYRADKARSTRTGGAGLGLAIAKRLVEAHGGHIAAENRKGARFTVALPRSSA